MEIANYAPAVNRFSSFDEIEGSADQIHVRALVIAGLLSIALWVPLFKLGETLLTSLFLS